MTFVQNRLQGLELEENGIKRDLVAEAKKAFALYPSDENKKVLELIKTKLISKQDSTKKSIL